MKRRSSGRGTGSYAQELGGLTDLGIKDLKERWRAFYGTEPHQRMSRELLIAAVAYRLQENALGGLKVVTRRLLARVAESTVARQPRPVAAARKTSAGTVLIREWRATSHRVSVLDDGVIYRGKRYRSLSEVAHVITGTRWSGPLFFGLKKRAEGCHDGTR